MSSVAVMISALRVKLYYHSYKQTDNYSEFPDDACIITINIMYVVALHLYKALDKGG